MASPARRSAKRRRQDSPDMDSGTGRSESPPAVAICVPARQVKTLWVQTLAVQPSGYPSAMLRRVVWTLLILAGLAGALVLLLRWYEPHLIYFPARDLDRTPASLGLAFEDV